MNLLVATLGPASTDPRTTNVIASLTENAMEPAVLEVQAFTPPWRDLRKCRYGWRLHSTTPTTSMSWSSRSMARREFEQCLRLEADSVPAFRGLLRSERPSPTSAYLYNRLAIAFHGLNRYLESDSAPHMRLVIAEDFEIALASVLLERRYQHDTCYDAHELHTVAIRLFGDCIDEAFVDALEEAEHYIWRQVSLLITVSPGLAEIMTAHRLQEDVVSVPNFVPKFRSNFSPDEGHHPLRCIYAGGAAPYRNVQTLISVWPGNEEAPTLDLFVPPSQWRDEAEAAAKSNVKIRVNDPVPAEDLVALMSNFDIGILPYAYPHPYTFASPNKFGEYLAAGLAIVAHPQEFTQRLINHFQVGICADLTSVSGVASVLSEAQPEYVAACKRNARSAFEASLNWDDAFQAWLDRMQQVDRSTQSAMRIRQDGQTSRSTSHQMTLNGMFDFFLDHLRPALIRLEKTLRRLRLTRWLPNRLVQRLS